MVRVLICDDQTVVREGLAAILSTDDEIEVVGLAHNGEEALALAATDRADVVLMDLNMPVMNGLEFLQRAQKEAAYKEIPVIIISTEGKEEDTIRGLKMGARGYVKKPFQASELHSLIEKITGA